MRPKRFGRRPTRQEFAARTEFTRELIAQGLRFGTIKRQFRDEFGALSARTVARYVARAGGDLKQMREKAASKAKAKARAQRLIKQMNLEDGADRLVRVLRSL